MKNILLSLFFIPTFSFAQKHSDEYIQGSVGLDFIKNIDLTFSGRFDGGANINNSLFLGVGIGATKFDKNTSLYVPIYINISFTYKPELKVYPIFSFQPGYGLYNQTKRVGYENITTKGGFTFYGGGGIGFTEGKDSKGYITFGYTYYSFQTGTIKSNLNGYTIKLGFLVL